MADSIMVKAPIEDADKKKAQMYYVKGLEAMTPGFFSFRHMPDTKLVEKNLNMAKKLDPSLNDKCNKLLSNFFVQTGFEQLSNTPWSVTEDKAAKFFIQNSFEKAIEYWGASKKEIYSRYTKLGDEASKKGNEDEAIKFYSAAKKYK